MKKVVLIPIFDNNYVFVIINQNQAILIDPGESNKVLEYISNSNLQLSGVLITHHHHDHIDGLPEIKKHYPNIKIYAPLQNKQQIPLGTNYVQEGQLVDIIGLKFKVMELPGHTLGHIAYYNELNNWIFSGDVLFGLGCGRLFEGTAEQAFNTLSRFKQLPPETLVYCTHEYTEANLKFCKSLNVDTPELHKYETELVQKRKGNCPSVPLNLGSEFLANPFLICNNVQDFADMRNLRNTFKA